MIYEIRTYTLQPNAVPEVEKRFAEAYEYRRKYSELLGFWHTEVGTLNQVVQMWPYDDMAHRERVRKEVAGDKNWPPKMEEQIVAVESEILQPFPFISVLPPGKYGPVYELRYYHFKPGQLPAIMESWEKALPARLERSKVVLAGSVELGEANRFIHIWPYSSMNERLDVRGKAVADGIWPPPGGGPARYFAQHNKIMLPASFSPLQ
jgi:hypothetical protein